MQCLKADLPELPGDKRKRFMGEYDLNFEEAKLLTEEKKVAAFFEQVISELKSWVENLEKAKDNPKIWEENRPLLIKSASNIIINNLLPLLEQKQLPINNMKLNPENMAELVTLIFAKKLNSQSAISLLPKMIETGADPSHLMKDLNLSQITDEKELAKIIGQVIEKNPQPVADYKKGKEKALQVIIGQVMAQTQGKANAEIVLKLLKEKLNS